MQENLHLNFDFATFILAIREKDWQEIYSETQQARSGVARLAPDERDCNRELERSRFLLNLDEFLCFFGQLDRRPRTVSGDNWKLYHDVIKRLVQKGQINPIVLDLFNNDSESDPEKDDET